MRIDLAEATVMKRKCFLSLFLFLCGLPGAIIGQSDVAGSNNHAIRFGSPSSFENCGNAWTIVPTPNFGAGNNELYGIAVVSANDVWAVGRYSDAAGYKTLAMHWDGSAWTIVPTPNVGSVFNHLFSVAAASADDIWAVGASSDNNVLFQTLIEHWDGTQWSTISSPLAPGTASYLYGITAVGANDIWAVGYIQVGFSAQQPLVVHWDGTSWSLVLSPGTSPANNDVLWSVSAVSANDVWAAGNSVDRVSGNYNTLVEHWDGSAWSVVPSLNPSGSIYNFLWGIEALSGNDIWVFGRSYTGSSYPGLIEHWDSNTWSIVPSPSEQSYTELYGASAQSATDVWAVGREGDGFNTNLTLIQHWDGSSWRTVSHPEPVGSTESYLYRVKGISPNDVWAVGAYLKDDTVYQTLIERYTSVPCIVPSGVVSRKTHGTAGTFDLDLTNGTGIECRSGGVNGDYTLVFSFANPLTSVDNAAVTTGSGSVTTSDIDSADAHNYVVSLTGVTNAQVITVSLSNVTDSVSNFSPTVAGSMTVLVGDTNADGLVNSADIGQTKSRSGNVVNATNFREDVNTDGFINSADIGLVKSKSGTGIH